VSSICVLGWGRYSNALIAHGDRVLSLAALAFEGTKIACKVSFYKAKKGPSTLRHKCLADCRLLEVRNH